MLSFIVNSHHDRHRHNHHQYQHHHHQIFKFIESPIKAALKSICLVNAFKIEVFLSNSILRLLPRTLTFDTDKSLQTLTLIVRLTRHPDTLGSRSRMTIVGSIGFANFLRRSRCCYTAGLQMPTMLAAHSHYSLHTTRCSLLTLNSAHTTDWPNC